MKRQVKKIVLTRETLRELSASQISEAEGGAFPQTNFDSCRCPTLSCAHPGFC